MINVRVGGMEAKKCSLPGSEPARNEKGKNMTCTSNTSCSHSTSTFSLPTAPTSRIIKKPRKMKFLSLSPPSPPPQLDQIENCSPTYSIKLPIRRRSPSSSITPSCRRDGKSSGRSTSSSSYPFTIRGLATTTAPILIPFLFLYIVIVPVSGTANDMLSTYSPSFLHTTSSHVTPSTVRSVLSSSSSSPEHLLESLQSTQTLENHHHHPHSSSVSPPHLVELPLADEPTPTNNNGQQQPQAIGHPHSCYVCLPPEKTSRDAEEILSIFPVETREHIPDCASFGSHNANHFEFKCPPEYVGCLLRIHGKNESRSCSKLPLNDCKTVNSVERCYCMGPLCNGNRPEILLEESESDERVRSQLEDEQEERGTRKIWQKGETDDEDLLGPHHLDTDGMQDDTGDYGSGSEPPPGVIHQYTSTAKPTLIPNIRPDTRTTTPKSVSGAPGNLFSAFTVPFTSIIIPISTILLSLVPLLLPVIQLQLADLSSLQLLVKNQ